MTTQLQTTRENQAATTGHTPNLLDGLGTRQGRTLIPGGGIRP